MSKEEENWNELKVEKPQEEKVEYEIEEEGEEKVDVSPSNIEPVKEEQPKEEQSKEEQPKELEGVDTKGAQKRIRQLIKQRKDREDDIAKLIKANEELAYRVNKQNTDFNQLSKLNLAATEKQLTDKLELARNAYQSAHDEGDTKKILKAQEFLNETQNDLKTLSVTKQQFQGQEGQSLQQRPQPQQQVPQPTADPRAEEWASKNNWFGQDRVMTAAALAIDNDLKEEGFNPTESEYYSEIDSRLRATFPQKFTTKEEVRQQESSPAQVVSGVSRSSPGSSKKGKVKLTKEDIRLANKWNVSLEQYAQEKLKAEQSDGEYTTINTQRGG